MMAENKKARKILLIIIPLTLLIISLLFFVLNVKSDSKETSEKSISGIQVNINNNEVASEGRKTRILGDNNNQINENNRYLLLKNDKSNSVFFQFDIVENDSVIYSSKLIEPGKMEMVDIYTLLDKGEHTLDYLITTYNMETKEICLSDVKQIKKIIIN